jgi:hypothetical protein
MNLSDNNKLIFRPYFVQKGQGPHLLDWAYASDENGDAFHSYLKNGGILRSPKGERKAAFTRLKNLQERWHHLKT